MNFILCDNKTYEKKYRAEAYKHVRLEEVSDLAGYAKITVYIEEDDWIYDIHDDRCNYLQEQLEALAMFGYISLIYVDEDGFESKFTSTVALGEDFSHKQGGSTPPIENSSHSLTEEERMSLLETEDGCAGGACSI